MAASENNLGQYVRELAIEVACLRTQMEERAGAVQLQAHEYSRRLEELNHAHRDRMEREREFIGREAYEAQLGALEKDLALKSSAMETKMVEIQLWRQKVIGIAIGVGAASGVIGGLISALFTKLIRP